MRDNPAEVIAKQIGYENDSQHAFALAASNLYILALQAAGWKLVKDDGDLRLLAEKRDAVTHWKMQLNEALAEIERLKQRIVELEK